MMFSVDGYLGWNGKTCLAHLLSFECFHWLWGNSFLIPFDVTAAVAVPFGGPYLKSSPNTSCKVEFIFFTFGHLKRK